MVVLWTTDIWVPFSSNDVTLLNTGTWKSLLVFKLNVRIEMIIKNTFTVATICHVKYTHVHKQHEVFYGLGLYFIVFQIFAISPKPFGRSWRKFYIEKHIGPPDHTIFPNFQISKTPRWQTAAILKKFNAISLQPFDWFWWNSVGRCTLALPTRWANKNLKNVKIQDGGRRPSWKS